jgi:putative ABC transport system permease protein
MDTLIRDIRYGSRMLIKNPGFTLVAVFALALGIGANTAIFSVVNSVLLRPLPYADPDRLVQLREVKLPQHPDFSVTPGTFIEWQKRSTTFEYVAAYFTTNVNLVSSGEPERLRAARVSAGMLDLLGVTPAQGRFFLAEEDQPGRDTVAIISHGLWQRQFGATAGLQGQALKLNGIDCAIVGVMPPKFTFPASETDVWLPMAFDENDRQAFGAHFISVVGRLKPDSTVQQSQSEMTAIAEQLAEEHSDVKSGWTVKVVPLLDYTVGSTKLALLVLLGAVAFVLLIACANVANLMLARAATRQKEIAIRTALGSSRWRIARQLLTESVLLAVAGGGAGLLLAVWGVDALLALAPQDLPRLNDVSIDARVLIFTLGITLATGVVFGLAPALQASNPELNETLKDAGRGSSEGSRRHRIRNILVVSELALSLTLLIGGGLMIRSFWRLQHVDPGFNTSNALAVTMSLPQQKYAEARQRAAFYTQLIQNISRLPGVVSAGITNVLPIAGDFVLGVVVEGSPQTRDSDLPKTNYFAVSPDYFKAMGIPVLRGRPFDERDKAGAPRVVIINQTMADRLFKGQDPIGKRIHITMAGEIFREIIGVVGDVKQSGLDKDTLSQTYEPFQQAPSPFANLIVRSDRDPSNLAGAIRSEVLALDREQPVARVQTLEQMVASSVAQQRFAMILMGSFALVAFVLAAVGLYGVMSYSVAQRTHEIGIRMALGAKQSDVLRMVVGQGAVLAVTGVAMGLCAAFAVTRLMASLLFEVTATDPLTFAVIAALLGGVALLASFIPARRATKVDPMVALRYE